ncbi:MAG: hypothetical protein HXX10_04465 [Rhodoplanes sp.]|uniref:hypothetical protein n=1 Tax=Rhodoplanes sp. TaxID=1968906 RepID=UPI0017D1E39C|nr:hypothetical protein [Rhodoplanes sp.]NVO13269.1 hypothetical protein [Rhodoplanes sp.]
MLAVSAGLGVAHAQAGPGYTVPSAEERAQARRAARGPTRIQVTPNRQLYRECVDWLAIERRPSGDVITPQMRCRWAYR